MKKCIYLLTVTTLILASCIKNDPVQEVPIGVVDPNDYNIELKQAEFRKNGAQWTPILNGDTLRFNWSLFSPLFGEPLGSQFGPGNFSISSNSALPGIGKNGIFPSKGDHVFFGICNNITNPFGRLGQVQVRGRLFFPKNEGVRD